MLEDKPLPRRLTAAEVCDLGRFSRITLTRRIAAKTMPEPVDRARYLLFDRDAVLKALRMFPDDGAMTGGEPLRLAADELRRRMQDALKPKRSR